MCIYRLQQWAPQSPSIAGRRVRIISPVEGWVSVETKACRAPLSWALEPECRILIFTLISRCIYLHVHMYIYHLECLYSPYYRLYLFGVEAWASVLWSQVCALNLGPTLFRWCLKYGPLLVCIYIYKYIHAYMRTSIYFGLQIYGWILQRHIPTSCLRKSPLCHLHS